MAGKSNIEWTDATWNPVTGCAKVSQGCKNCYAKALHDRRHKGYLAGNVKPKCYATPFEEVKCWPERLEQPLGWKKPGMVFVNSMSDLFHEAVPFEFIDRVFAVMALTNHKYQILTKRSKRMREYFVGEDWIERLMIPISKMGGMKVNEAEEFVFLPLPNVWLGVSVENQETADARIPELLATPAAVRFVSYEPALGAVDFTRIKLRDEEELVPECGINALIGEGYPHGWQGPDEEIPALDWIICGGESGPGARPMHPDWARSVRDKCQGAGVSFFFKQWESWIEGRARKDWIGVPNDGALKIDDPKLNVVEMSRVGKARAGRLLDGREWNEMPVLSGAEGPERT